MYPQSYNQKLYLYGIHTYIVYNVYLAKTKRSAVNRLLAGRLCSSSLLLLKSILTKITLNCFFKHIFIHATLDNFPLIFRFQTKKNKYKTNTSRFWLGYDVQ